MAVNEKENIYSPNYVDLNANKIGFLSGTQETLNKYMKDSGDAKSGTAKEGCFYLTTDTHRLYIGRKTAENKIYPVPVNQGISTVSSVNQLPSSDEVNIGEFYYAVGENVLCIFTGEKGWVQLNPDTYLTTNANNVAVAAKDAEGKVAVSSQVADSAGHTSKGAFTLKEGSNITLTADAQTNEITIASQGTSYTFGTATNASKGIITLTPAGGTATNVEILAADGSGIAVSSNSKGQITLGLSSETNGGVNSGMESTNGSGETTNGFTFTVKDAGGDVSASIDPVITYGSGTTSTVHFDNGTATLDVYTKAQTDSAIDSAIKAQLQTADAMTFKGTVGTDGTVETLPTSNVQNGDTYKAASDFSIGEDSVKAGDLIIANGTENSETGFIGDDLKWIVVSSGNEAVYVSELLTHGVKIKENNSQTDLASLALSNTDGIIGLTDGASDSNGNRTITLSHKGYTAKSITKANDITQTAKNEATFVAVTGFSSDAYGHVTGVETSSLKVVDTHNAIDEINTSATKSSANGKDTIAVSINVEDIDENAIAPGAFDIESETLSLSKVDNDSKAIINVELTWGSF